MNHGDLLDNILLYGTVYSTEEILMTRVKRDLKSHPNIENSICKMLKEAKYETISHKRLCKASDGHERACNVVDGTDSEWWTEMESAWIEVDLGLTHEIHNVEIQWWGTSVSKSYTVLTAVDEGQF